MEPIGLKIYYKNENEKKKVVEEKKSKLKRTKIEEEVKVTKKWEAEDRKKNTTKHNNITVHLKNPLSKHIHTHKKPLKDTCYESSIDPSDNGAEPLSLKWLEVSCPVVSLRDLLSLPVLL